MTTPGLHSANIWQGCKYSFFFLTYLWWQNTEDLTLVCQWKHKFKKGQNHHTTYWDLRLQIPLARHNAYFTHLLCFGFFSTTMQMSRWNKVDEPFHCLSRLPQYWRAPLFTSWVFTHHSCDTLSVSGVILQWRNRTSRPRWEEKELQITLSICFNMLGEPHG